MTTARSEAELVTLRKLAQELAHARKERMTSVHLLAAIAGRDGAAGGLLRERRLVEDALLKASRSFDDEGPDPIGRVMSSARDVSKRGARPGGAPTEPGALHLLLALLADRRSAAHRALESSGVDLGRLRMAAMQLALGVVATRRSSPQPVEVADPGARPARARLEPPPSSRPGASSPTVAVPLFPPAPRPPKKKEAEPPPPPPAPEPPRRPARRSPAAPPRGHADAERFSLDRAAFPVLTAVGKNLSVEAAHGRLERVIGRDEEIDRALDVLAKRHANSPCLIGPAGVGKTSVARGVAQRLVDLDQAADGPARIVVEVVVSELVAGTGTRGALAERLAAIRAEVKGRAGKIILFVDEVHELLGGGALDEAMAELKLALARGELSLLCATGPEEYRKTIESDAALARRFTVIEIEEPSEEDAFLLLRSVAGGLAAHHALAYEDEALAAAIAWSIRYLPGRALPDKAVAILDLAGARASRRAAADALALGAPRGKRGADERPSVGPAEVAEVVSELADVPVERLLETDRARMLALEKLLAERVVGHAPALARIATVLRRNAAGLRGRRPIGSFLLLGPTGVGKTETAKAVAEALFHSGDAMTRLDLSEYAEAHSIARLVGAPPGYVGHEAGGQLTEAVRRRPYQVILLDEIEKAHRDVLESFLQVFDEGRLTDGRGRSVDFTNTVLLLTSNLGSREGAEVRSARTVGFAQTRSTHALEARMSEAMIAAARAELPPELYNRLDEVLCFGPLSRADVAEIARRLLDGLGSALEHRGVRFQVDDAAVEALLAAGGFDVDFGARPMKRAIMRLVEAPLAEMILRGELEPGSVALVTVEAGEIVVDALPPALRPARSAAG